MCWIDNSECPLDDGNGLNPDHPFCWGCKKFVFEKGEEINKKLYDLGILDEV